MRHTLKTLFALSLPIVLGNMTVAVNELVNRFVLGRASLAALAASLPGSMLALVFTGVFVNTVGYATALVAEAHGADDAPRERRTFAQALWLSVATIPVFIVAVPLGLVMLRGIGHDADVLRDESIYFCFSALGGLLSVFVTAIGTYPAGRGRTGLPSAAALTGCLIDMVATPLLVLKADLGITGAGLAKVLGTVAQLLVLSVGVGLSLRGEKSLAGTWRYDASICRRLLRLGLPFGFSSLIGSGTFTVFVMSLGVCGAEALAVGNLCFSLNNLFNTAQNAIESAVVIHAGTCKGAGDAEGPRQGFRAGTLLSLLALAVCYAPILAASDAIMSFFLTDGATPHALSLARFFLCGLFLSGIFETLKHTATGTLRGIGQTDYVFFAHLFISGCLWAPAVLLLAHLTHDAVWLWPSIAVYTLIHAGVLVRRAIVV